MRIRPSQFRKLFTLKSGAHSVVYFTAYSSCFFPSSWPEQNDELSQGGKKVLGQHDISRLKGWRLLDQQDVELPMDVGQFIDPVEIIPKPDVSVLHKRP